MGFTRGEHCVGGEDRTPSSSRMDVQLQFQLDSLLAIWSFELIWSGHGSNLHAMPKWYGVSNGASIVSAVLTEFNEMLRLLSEKGLPIQKRQFSPSHWKQTRRLGQLVASDQCRNPYRRPRNQ